MEPDEEPPPYSVVDPLLAQSNNRDDANALTDAHRQDGNHTTSPQTAPQGANEHNLADSPVHDEPAPLGSAASYFAERPPPPLAGEERQDTLHHCLTIHPRSQWKDFRRLPRCWLARTTRNEITQEDWDVFVKFLFPPHLGPAASSEQLSPYLRAQIRRDRKDSAQEMGEGRRLRMAAVVAEWNRCFFGPRGMCVVLVYTNIGMTCSDSDSDSDLGSRSIGDGSAPASPLCPNCFPVASAGLLSQDDYGARLDDEPSASWLSTSSWPLDQLSRITSQVQDYGQYLNEQAQGYRDQITAQAEDYSNRAVAGGRWTREQVEYYRNMAIAGNRWVREQAGYQRREVGRLGDLITWPSGVGVVGGRESSRGTGGSEEGCAEGGHPTGTTCDDGKATTSTLTSRSKERSRRSSVSSALSESSPSSVESTSTISGFSLGSNTTDLASARHQLQSLDNLHGRDLYAAAKDLSRQVKTITDTTSQGTHHREKHKKHRERRKDKPKDHQSSSCNHTSRRQDQKADKRAASDEVRATTKAFRRVFRRAREECREDRRAAKRGAT